MRANLKLPVQKTQKVNSFPAPVGGINGRDPINAMPPTDAYGLVNWIPQQFGLSSRAGYAEWYPGLGDAVKTIMHYFPSTAAVPSNINFQSAPTSMPGTVLACTDDEICDITNSAAYDAGDSIFSLSGSDEAGRFSWVNFSNSGGNFLLACSEADGYHVYDGTTFAKVSSGSGSGEVDGANPGDFCHVSLWKRRAWFVIQNSSKVAYLGVDSLYGTASELDVGPFLRHGGSVAWTANWTIDAGEGIDDYLVIAGQNGDVIIYQGTDPSEASSFSLVGVWYVGELPTGRRGYAALGGDLLILSASGLFPVSFLTRGGSSELVIAGGGGEFVSKINQTLAKDISRSYNLYGWEMTVAPRESLLLITTPILPNRQRFQYAMHLGQRQWTTFERMPILCAASISGWLLFGDVEGDVHIGFTTFDDGRKLDGTPGADIVGRVDPAFSYFESPGATKHFTMVRPTFLAEAEPGVGVRMNTDFFMGNPTLPSQPGSVAGSQWDSALWDDGRWAGGAQQYARWRAVAGLGYSGSLSLTTQVNSKTILLTIDYMYETGGAL